MEFPCGHCGHRIPARDELVGEYVVCAACERMNQIPDPPPMALTDQAVAAILSGLRCPHCEYALRTLRENTCPECGRRFDPMFLARTGWGQTWRPPDPMLILFVGVILLIMLMCSGIIH